jgi:hypothetical protein
MSAGTLSARPVRISWGFPARHRTGWGALAVSSAMPTRSPFVAAAIALPYGPPSVGKSFDVHEATACAEGRPAPEEAGPSGATVEGAAPDEAAEPDDAARVAVVASNGTPTAAMTAVARRVGLDSRRKATRRVMPAPRGS